MPVICVINMPYNGLYDQLVVYKANTFHDVQFIDECLENAAACKKVTQEQRNGFIKEGSKTANLEIVPERRMHPVLAVLLNK